MGVGEGTGGARGAPTLEELKKLRWEEMGAFGEGEVRGLGRVAG